MRNFKEIIFVISDDMFDPDVDTHRKVPGLDAGKNVFYVQDPVLI